MAACGLNKSKLSIDDDGGVLKCRYIIFDDVSLIGAKHEKQLESDRINFNVLATANRLLANRLFRSIINVVVVVVIEVIIVITSAFQQLNYRKPHADLTRPHNHNQKVVDPSRTILKLHLHLPPPTNHKSN